MFVLWSIRESGWGKKDVSPPSATKRKRQGASAPWWSVRCVRRTRATKPPAGSEAKAAVFPQGGMSRSDRGWALMETRSVDRRGNGDSRVGEYFPPAPGGRRAAAGGKRTQVLPPQKNKGSLSATLYFSSSGGRTRTSDLRVMSPTSYQLLYPAVLDRKYMGF